MDKENIFLRQSDIMNGNSSCSQILASSERSEQALLSDYLLVSSSIRDCNFEDASHIGIIVMNLEQKLRDTIKEKDQYKRKYQIEKQKRQKLEIVCNEEHQLRIKEYQTEIEKIKFERDSIGENASLILSKVNSQYSDKRYSFEERSTVYEKSLISKQSIISKESIKSQYVKKLEREIELKDAKIKSLQQILTKKQEQIEYLKEKTVINSDPIWLDDVQLESN